MNSTPDNNPYRLCENQQSTVASLTEKLGEFFKVNYDIESSQIENEFDAATQQSVQTQLTAWKKQEKQEKGCMYVFTRGKNKGSTCKSKLALDFDFCTKHLTPEQTVKLKNYNEAVKSNSTDLTNKALTSSGSKSASSAKPLTARGVQKLQQQREANKSIIKNIENSNIKRKVKKNQHNNYEDIATGMLIDISSHQAYGRQVDDKIMELSADDIEICKANNMLYRLPQTLQYNDGTPYDKDLGPNENDSEDEDEEDLEADEEEVNSD